MDAKSRSHLEAVRRAHVRRFQELEKQAAIFGVSTPPHITIEMQDIQTAIDEIDLKMAQLGTLATYAGRSHQ